MIASAALVPLARAATRTTTAEQGSGKALSQRHLNKDEQARLVLNRFTFGEQPGEVQAIVDAGGWQAWFDRQLHPSKIDDSVLDQKLAMYPALRMTDEERRSRYPDPATVRRLARSGQVPAGTTDAQVILRDQVEFLEARKQAKANAAQTGAAPAPLTEADVQPTSAMQTDALLAMEPDARYHAVLAMEPEQLLSLRKAVRQSGGEQKITTGMTALQRETLLSLGGSNRMLVNELTGERLLRDVYSNRQLQAVMTDFWLNHFNIDAGKSGEEPALLPQFERTVREHALGHFEDLLVATAESPAMLMYLDNATSIGPDSPAAQKQNLTNAPNRKAVARGLNENYARELMELHTLGVNGGYTQTDVTEVAKVLTGWTITRPGDRAGNPGEFQYAERRHEPGPKHVLGKDIREDGQGEGLQLLHMLATSPATARFLSQELAERFVSDTPPPAMVRRMTAAYLKSHGDIAAVLRAMVRSPEMFTAATQQGKWKTPLEFVASADRATGAEIRDPEPQVQALRRLGMPLYGCQPPTGYHWDQQTWLSSGALIGRMKFAEALATNRMGGTFVPPMASSETALEEQFFDGPVSASTRAAVLQAAQVGTEETVARARPASFTQASGDGAKMAGLLLGSPEFQRR